ncbi:MAG: hypothetical protein JWR54_3535 [Mucilaginibacter sp.]|nr:hypothetical protein [Mucilaginibacter sp.]
MVVSTTSFSFKKLKSLADWKLLLFLVLFLNVKMAVKIPAIALIYLLQFNFKFGFSLKNSRLPLFYLLAIAIAVLNWVISRNYLNINYNIVLLTGIGFWVLCILAMHQVKLFVENNDTETIHRTIVIFFIINAVLSLCNLALIIFETGAINPYTYQGQYQKYFIGTGDYIRGITFDTSTTNAVLNALGVIYFLTKKNAIMLLVCMAVMLSTASNFTNMVLLGVLALIFVFKSSRDQKSLIVACMVFLVVFMVKISPQNNTYVAENLKRAFHLGAANQQMPVRPKLGMPITLMPDSLLTTDQKKWKVAQRYTDSVYVANHTQAANRQAKKTLQPVRRPAETVLKTESGRIFISKPDINTMPYQHVIDTTPYQRLLLAFIDSRKASLPLSGQDNFKLSLPGKAIGWLQTLHFLQQHPSKIFTGDGMGNFSSKLAFRASGLGFAGGYPQKFIYLDPDFLSNHLDVYLNFFSKKTDVHSLANNPNSVYDQLLAEYGILGLTAFLIYYLGFFLKRYKQLTYGLPILLVVLSMFFIEYWFEQLSILIFFEMLLLLNIKETSSKTTVKYAY